MRIDREKRKKYILYFVIFLTTFLNFICFITFFINFGQNIGVMPLIFLFLSLYYLVVFVHDIASSGNKNRYKAKTEKPKIRYVIYFFVCVAFYILSFITLWQ